MEQHGKVPRSYNENNTISEEEMELRRGPWTVDEDFTLINYIAHHGEGRWNSLARCAGLKRTGKSCRLRWLNYLRPDVRRGNITLEEQLLILELHSRWGNRWSKIAQHLPGRTDNEIKNYWRTRVQKHAKQLRCDVNSKQFKDTMRYLWMPRLVERINQAANNTTYPYLNNMAGSSSSSAPAQTLQPNNSSSSESFGTPVSDLTDCYNNNNNNNYPAPATINNSQDYYPAPADNTTDQSLTSPIQYGYFSQTTSAGLDFMDQSIGTNWMDATAGDVNLWDVDDMWFLHHHFDTTSTSTV